MRMDARTIKLNLQCLFYHMAKLLGLFRLAVKLTENDYRILCFHSGSIHDEHLFWPGVFMTKAKFKKHIALIKKYCFNVLPLDEVVKNAGHQNLAKRSLVLTFDDGFYSTKKIIAPLL